MFQVTDFSKNVERDVDVLLEKQPEELRRIRENREFLIKVEEEPIVDEEAEIKAFTNIDKKGRPCVVSVNLNSILKENVRGRDCFVIDHLCKMFLEMTYADLGKYRKKKKSLPFDYKWLIIIMFGLVGMFVFLIFILPMLGI